jgi:uncharacterized membrane protein YraQ (UPF0718 family)
MDIIIKIFIASWDLLLESSIYILFGLIISGLFRVFLNPESVAHHLGKGRFSSVFKAALLGIPIPLCSCGVLPAAASLKKQGANNGATTAFLISTPESGADSIAISYALLDPIMTVLRPLVAFVTATVAGITENLFSKSNAPKAVPDLTCPVDGCCDGTDCPPEAHRNHHTLFEKITAGLRYAFTEVWGDLAGLFMIGLILAGIITALIPDDIFTRYLGGGLSTMLIMLAAGIPLYICATASTPIAAALILKGASPGAALVFLIAGPATNITSLTVLFGILGKRAAVIYLLAIAVLTVIFGLITDQVYTAFDLSAQATVGQASEIIPFWLQAIGVVILMIISIKPIVLNLKQKFGSSEPVGHDDGQDHGASSATDHPGIACSGPT